MLYKLFLHSFEGLFRQHSLLQSFFLGLVRTVLDDAFGSRLADARYAHQFISPGGIQDFGDFFGLLLHDLPSLLKVAGWPVEFFAIQEIM